MIPENCNFGSVYLRCVKNKVPHSLRDRMNAIFPHISQAYVEYVARGYDATLHAFPVVHAFNGSEGEVTGAEVHALYDSAMIRKSGGGRADYDRIRTSASLGVCPYCGQLPVKTLDHFLPRSKWKMLSVCQINLVPACRDCNSEKKEYTPTSPSDTLFHPYFDDSNRHRWLAFDVMQVRPIQFLFKVDCGEGDAVFLSRAQTHFEKFNLKLLYETQAATEILSLAASLFRLHSLAGIGGVRQEMLTRASDNEAVSLNSWRSALYRGAASSDWFCDMSWM